MDLSWICHLFLLTALMTLEMTDALRNIEEGYCQVYSYNMKDRNSGHYEKHYFTCCNNTEEKSCNGQTYQKPTIVECKL